MRDIGIVKWFGGHNMRLGRENNYGFITREVGSDLYVHRRQLRAGRTELDPGEPVSFIVHDAPSEERTEAWDVLPLEEERDLAVIERAARSANPVLCQAAVRAYKAIGEIERAAVLVQENIRTFPLAARAPLAREFPTDIHRRHKGLRAELTATEQVEIFSAWLKEQPRLLDSPAIRAEIAAAARADNSDARSELASLIPRERLVASQALRSALPVVQHLILLVELIGSDPLLNIPSDTENEQEEQQLALQFELAERLVNCDETVWFHVPDILVLTAPIWKVANSNQRWRSLVTVVNVAKEHSLQITAQRLTELLTHTPQGRRVEHIRPIRAFAIRQHEVILQLDPDDRATASSELLQAGEPYPAWLLPDLPGIAKASSPTRRRQLLESIPADILRMSRDLRILLPPDRHVAVCMDLLAQAFVMQGDTNSILEELVEALKNASDATWFQLPVHLLVNSSVCLAASPQRLIQCVAAHLGNSRALDNSHLLEIVRHAVERTEQSQRIELVHLIRDWAREQIELVAALPLASLPPVEQVDWVWLSLVSGHTATWKTITPTARILAVYRAAFEGYHLPIIDEPQSEENRLVRAAITLLRARYHQEHHSAAFNTAHTLIQDEVIERAWNLSQPLHLYPLLPLCRPGLSTVAYCEGRPWKAAAAFCPRRGGACACCDADTYAMPEHKRYWAESIDAESGAEGEVSEATKREGPGWFSLFRPNWTGTVYLIPDLVRHTSLPTSEKGWKLVHFDPRTNDYVHVRWAPLRRGSGAPATLNTSYGQLVAGAKQPVYYQLHGAHIEPINDLAWQNWSLHELLAAASVQPDLQELRSPGEYVNRLTGWINRLNEIRERLKCRVCGETMIPNYAYARNLARYNATIVSCQQGVGHNQDVYLNHCWACGSIIDSRDTPHTAGGLYICGACGSAPYTLKHFGDSSDSGFVDDAESRLEMLRVVMPLVPKDGHNAQTYAQGDICPSCGEPGMAFSGARIHRVCRVCKHKLEIPSPSKRTGPRCCYCRKGPATLTAGNGGDPERICISCGKNQETPNTSHTLSKPTTLDTDRTPIYDPFVDPPIEAYINDTDWSET